MKTMKALITRTYSYNKKLYHLQAGKEIPQMPAELKKLLESAGYIGKTNTKTIKPVQKVIIDEQEHNIEEEELFVNFDREEEN